MKLVFGVFLVASSLVVATARADLFVDNEIDISQLRWQLSLGAGWSIPINSKGTIPATNMTPVLGGWTTPGVNDSPTGVMYGTSQSKTGNLRQSTSYEGSLFYSLAPWLSVGMFGGTTGNHYVVDSTDDLNFIFTYIQPGVPTFSFPVTDELVRYGLTYSRAVPAVRIGPWIGRGRLQVRPYITAGAGWYMVDQYAGVGIRGFNFSGSHLVKHV